MDRFGHLEEILVDIEAHEIARTITFIVENDFEGTYQLLKQATLIKNIRFPDNGGEVESQFLVGDTVYIRVFKKNLDLTFTKNWLESYTIILSLRENGVVTKSKDLFEVNYTMKNSGN